MIIDVVSAVPGLVTGSLQYSIVKIAQKKGLAQINVYDVRDFSTHKQRQIDDYPFGGGGGMVIKVEPLFACIEHLIEKAKAEGVPHEEIIYLTPDGELLKQPTCNRLSLAKRLMMICGHYKGIDQRVRDYFVSQEISIGDYVISGGEQAATVLIDAVVRLIPGVLGNAVSALSDSFQDGLLDAPVYTRPAEFRGLKVPEALTSGDHKRIDAWREQQRYERTKARRPDLLAES